MFVRGGLFQLSLMFVGKARSLPESGGRERYLLGEAPALPANIRQGWRQNATDKHSSLLQKFINYGRTVFKTLVPGVKVKNL